MSEALIIIGAEYLIAVSAATLFVYFFFFLRERRQEFLLLLALSLPLAYALARIAGLLYSHPQPFVEWGSEPLIPHEVDNAFPSDHVLFATVFAATIGFFNRALGIVLVVVALLIGVARVGAGLHNTGDVFASIILAQLAVLGALILLRYLTPKAQG